ncbi:hypothetical protein EDB82DRAFT_527636 [Fusarium venenatum]|uniref:uncharacterized protein n=1 Tax=Fusarium venenatum TaxID=56646 RepID=UPI001DA289D9|nr:hypothetical protein EDB82DRAFT_527636 [Fusarium venenatum]
MPGSLEMGVGSLPPWHNPSTVWAEPKNGTTGKRLERPASGMEDDWQFQIVPCLAVLKLPRLMFSPLSSSTMAAVAAVWVPVGAALVNFRAWIVPSGYDLT